MERCFYVILFNFLLIFAAHAQAEKEEVALAVERFNKAMVDSDEETLDNVTADELSYGHSSGVVEDKEAFIENVLNGPFDFFTLEGEDQTIKVTGYIALVRHTFVATGTNNGEAADVRIGNLQVWQNQSGEWKLLARQAFKL